MSMSSNEDPLSFHRRKTLKPLMEKRRRARINHCLSELKTFVGIQTQHTSSGGERRIEKADILEKTVHFIRHRLIAQQQQQPATFEDGFQYCLTVLNEKLFSSLDPISYQRLSQEINSLRHHASDSTILLSSSKNLLSPSKSILSLSTAEVDNQYQHINSDTDGDEQFPLLRKTLQSSGARFATPCSSPSESETSCEGNVSWQDSDSALDFRLREKRACCWRPW